MLALASAINFSVQFFRTHDTQQTMDSELFNHRRPCSIIGDMTLQQSTITTIESSTTLQRSAMTTIDDDSSAQIMHRRWWILNFSIINGPVQSSTMLQQSTITTIKPSKTLLQSAMTTIDDTAATTCPTDVVTLSRHLPKLSHPGPDRVS
jgi:hypothetical protein